MNDPSNRPPSSGGPLDAINDAFHDAYGRARGASIDDGPVLVVLADSIVLFRDGKREELRFTPRLYDVIKSVSHAPLAMYAAVARFIDVPFDEVARRHLDDLHRYLVHSRASIPSESPPELTRHLGDVLDATLSEVERARASTSASKHDLDAFARATGPMLLRLTDAATRIQLDALDAKAHEALCTMTAAERDALQVVVTGDHQARVRSLGVQYFRKRLCEPERAEHRVTFAEGISDEREALAMVGTRRTDREMALAFFGDATRLQRDVLGDAVTTVLRTMKLRPIAD